MQKRLMLWAVVVVMALSLTGAQSAGDAACDPGEMPPPGVSVTATTFELEVENTGSQDQEVWTNLDVVYNNQSMTLSIETFVHAGGSTEVKVDFKDPYAFQMVALGCDPTGIADAPDPIEITVVENPPITPPSP